ncbi:TPA: lateral flagellar hook-basal body complex protein LfiE [Aeromonas salmonicida]|uniref:lateral flagellar hook-basal body complex protein LfiE n=1 Tax=Aeromonas salmonicida TaxID=645 RepID=UPI00044B4978|nr:lateral flagellar hook-basal body complex protein LfiE [Aeromonas salmonicida]ASI21896.1 flagellar hook-basal body complex protein FliE [Aeromonas salmonicida]ASI26212.1 flagellar hook-basal body complex protein FliE [Aeromonas salmonicida]ASI30330.1 flagellar hook-basal body complex protein FliE [Aeromonas salmonicida]ELI6406564.1 lateral flagellar hook-basal body complex protein LfiE [Aeromonas salmonicida subsp. salmonicida]ELI6418227.1 lateral flagellar hook-basal body complex protein L
MKIEMMSSQVTLLQQMQRVANQAANQAPSIELNDASNVSFTDAMRDVVGRVNEQQNIASKLMTAVDAGQSDDLVGAMVASQKAGLSFSALMQVRNKLMTGFDDIMRMPL